MPLCYKIFSTELCCNTIIHLLVQYLLLLGSLGAHSLELEKAHTTSEFIIVVQNCGCALLNLASRGL